jgi:iron-regulated transporter 1
MEGAQKIRVFTQPLLVLVLQRCAVAASCVIFFLLIDRPSMSQVANKSLLATLALLACIEKVSSVMNLISIEKDWVRCAHLQQWCTTNLET